MAKDIFQTNDDTLRLVAVEKLARERKLDRNNLSGASVNKTSGLYAYVKVMDYGNLTTHTVTVHARDIR